MSAARLVRGLENDASGTFVTIEWDPGTGRGAALPASYFREVTLEKDGVRVVDGARAGEAFVADGRATGDRQIIVRFTVGWSAQA